MTGQQRCPCPPCTGLFWERIELGIWVSAFIHCGHRVPKHHAFKWRSYPHGTTLDDVSLSNPRDSLRSIPDSYWEGRETLATHTEKYGNHVLRRDDVVRVYINQYSASPEAVYKTRGFSSIESAVDWVLSTCKPQTTHRDGCATAKTASETTGNS